MALTRGRGAPPAYAQIADSLRSEILDGVLHPGAKLDSEPALAERFLVARATVAKGLDLLVQEGLIERRQGHGTFVTRPPLARPLLELTGFTEHVAGLGLNPGQRFVDYRETVVAPGTEDDLLAALPVNTEVVVARRVRLVDGEPAGLHRTAVPAEIARRIGFTEQALRSEQVSLYGLFAEADIEITSADEHLSARNANPEMAKMLRVQQRDALLRVRRLSRGVEGTLLEVVDAFYVGSLYDYRVGLTRRPAEVSQQQLGGTT